MQQLDQRFNNIMKRLTIPRDASIAVACSGGPDSMALALLLGQWAKEKKGKLVALTVDHGWHKDSTHEVKQIGGWLKKHGIAHQVLSWKGRVPTRNQREAARKGRYRLLTDYCRGQGITHLFVAHHQEDQAESFLLRLAQGGSVDGLSAMPDITTMYDVALVRPLLFLSKPELIDYLKKHRQRYITDPSHKDATLDRVKVRKLLPQLADAGISVERLARTARIMARARAHLEEEAGRFLKTHSRILPEGYAVLNLLPESEEIALRVLTTVMMIVGGGEVSTKTADLERLYNILQDKSARAQALSGCIFQRIKGKIIVYRDLRAMTGEKWLKAGEKCLWDNRFEVELRAAALRLKVGALTKSGWLRVAKQAGLKSACPHKNILYSLPALRDTKGNIVSVPILGYAADKQLRCSASFKKFL